MGFKPSFFLFLLIAAVAAAASLVFVLLVLLPFAADPDPDATAPVIIGGLVFCCCVCWLAAPLCSVCCLSPPGRDGVAALAAAAVGPEPAAVAPALSWVVLVVCWPPFMLCEDWEQSGRSISGLFSNALMTA